VLVVDFFHKTWLASAISYGNFHMRREELNNKFCYFIIGSHAQQKPGIYTFWFIDLCRFCTGMV